VFFVFPIKIQNSLLVSKAKSILRSDETEVHRVVVGC